MKYTFKLDERNTIEINKPLFWGRTSILANGAEVKKQSGENFYRISTGKGREKKLRILGVGLDGVPRVYIDEKKFQIARKLEWYEYLIVCMPLLIVSLGGVLGALTGAIATSCNFIIVRSDKSYNMRLLLIFAVSVSSIGLYWLLSILTARIAG
jgi:hypothetical protein